MRSFLIIVVLGLVSLAARADHIIGGEMYYAYLGKNGTKNQYRITLKLFVRCDATSAQFDDAVDISLYDGTGRKVGDMSGVPRNKVEKYTATDVDPCIVNPPYICYQIGYYSQVVDLDPNTSGYIATFQRCCRRTNLTNIYSENNNVGATYYTTIPGTANGFDSNNSPVFNTEKGVIVCANNRFVYNYAAQDPDGDSLVYSFSTAYDGASRDVPKPPTSPPPPYQEVSYKSPFSASQPLGDKVTIDPKTGVISGIAPKSGLYIVTVSAREYRNGLYIGEHKKEFQFTVENCVRQVVASLPDKFIDCDGYVINFINNSTPNKEYIWDFGDGHTLTTTDRSTFPYQYKDTGTYRVKLMVDRSSSCGDSAYSTVKVYPVLKPSFAIAGLCITKPTNFINTSRNDIGNIEYYKWDFGETGLQNDTSNLASPTWQYTRPGDYTISLFTRTTKGCEKSISNKISIYDKPPFTASGDTLLCFYDGLQLHAESELTGSYSWRPLYNITGEQTPTPYVTPKKDTAYTVTFTDQTGCINSKTVKIDVVRQLIIKAPADSTICTGDPVDLVARSDHPYSFTWTQIDTRQVVGRGQKITVTPPRSVSYQLQANLGTCLARDTVSYRTVDPPRAYAGLDTTICYGEKIWLQASGGTYYSWTPTATVASPQQPRTLVWPKDTTTYVVTVTDTLGCPKPVQAAVVVNVVPPVPAFAGNDTIVTKGQPFQLHGTGGLVYRWSPPDGLSNPNIPDPITNLNREIVYHLKVYSKEGCLGEDDIRVRFMSGPEIYVPTAFTPNGDGINDIFRPIPVGVTKLEFFKVYNRWGEEVYSTREYLKGWDGKRNGRVMDAGTYVWIVQGVNEVGQTIQKKGTVVLIR